MKRVRYLTLTVLCLFAVSSAHADTIISTPLGGFWNDPLTWIGPVPGATDDVIVVGPVLIGSPASCQSLHVEAAGSVIAGEVVGTRKLTVYGPVQNDGTIANNGLYWWLDLELYGDIHQAGTWTTRLTALLGSYDRSLSDTSANGIDSDIATAPDVSGDITVTTPATLTGFVDFTGYRVVLEPGSHLGLPATQLSGEIVAQGNELRFENWSYLQNCTVDDGVLVGLAEATFNVGFTTRLTVLGQLQNGSGGGAATVYGDLVNHGVIRNDHYSFFFRVHGDVENYGTIDTPQLSLEGVDVTHHFAMGPDAILEPTVFLPEFQAATLVVTTPATFGGGLGIGVGTLVLEPGAALHFPNHGGLTGFEGTVEANGNTITTEGTNSAISELTIDQAVLGDATLLGDLSFTGGLTVAGAVRGFTWMDANVSVEGLLRVEGSVEDNSNPLYITVLSDLENLGSMTNSRVTMAGTIDQYVGAGAGIGVPEFVIESGLDAASYQWYRDNVPLAGETGIDLVLNTVGAAEYGRYRCLGDGLASRDVYIAEILDTTDVPDLALAVLGQNHPNPFNPRTDIAFNLERSGPVSLVVYDLSGRVVERLVAGELSAGRHTIAWQPQGLASGTYVYRLRAAGVDQTRKCSLLK